MLVAIFLILIGFYDNLVLLFNSRYFHRRCIHYFRGGMDLVIIGGLIWPISLAGY